MSDEFKIVAANPGFHCIYLLHSKDAADFECEKPYLLEPVIAWYIPLDGTATLNIEPITLGGHGTDRNATLCPDGSVIGFEEQFETMAEYIDHIRSLKKKPRA
jgi:hypothetical protein